MPTRRQPPRHPRHDDRGATSAEYALLAAAIAAMVVAILVSLGQQVYRVHDSACDHIATTVQVPEC